MWVTEGISKMDGVTEVSPVGNERENMCVHVCVRERERENVMATPPHVIQGASFQLLVLCPQ